MKKITMKNKKYNIILLIFLFFTISSFSSLANTLYNLDILIELNKDGSADVTEFREILVNSGTENYLAFEDLQGSTITNFYVIEPKFNKKFESVSDWSSLKTIEDKKYKSGIVKTKKGYELCYGIGSYSHHIFELHYTITDYVKDFKGKKALFAYLAKSETSIPPLKFTARIRYKEPYNNKNNIPLNTENAEIYGFGVDGSIVFENGEVIVSTNEAMNDDQFVSVLIVFTKDIISSNVEMDMSIDQLKKMAFEGSNYGKDADSNKLSTLFKVLISAVAALVLSLTGLGILNARKISKMKKDNYYPYYKGEGSAAIKSKNYKKRYKDEYYHDVPYDGPISNLYSMLNIVGMTSTDEIITAYLLKWINEGILRPSKMDKGIFRKNLATLVIENLKPNIENPIERKLFEMIVSAAGPDYTLDEKELSNWVMRNISQYESWITFLWTNSESYMESHNYMETIKVKLVLFKSTFFHFIGHGEELLTNIEKFRNYLLDYTEIKEKESFNVTLWQDYMIFAGLMGISEEVMKEFRKLYPNIVDNSNINTNTLYISSSLSRSIMNSHRNHIKQQESSRSSGGGGSMSSGGGRGGFGGSKGGGIR